MDGNTFIGGITSHRAAVWCKNCNHIQWIHFVARFDIDDRDDIKCEICGHSPLKIPQDVEHDICMEEMFNNISPKTPQEHLGKIGKLKNVLNRMQDFK